VRKCRKIGDVELLIKIQAKEIRRVLECNGLLEKIREATHALSDEKL